MSGPGIKESPQKGGLVEHRRHSEQEDRLRKPLKGKITKGEAYCMKKGLNPQPV